MSTIIGKAGSFTEMIQFSDFQSWAQGLSIGGCTFVVAEQEGEPEYGEKVNYNAEYRCGQSGYILNFGELSEYQSYLMMAKSTGGAPFQLAGNNAVYIENDMGNRKMGMLAVEYKSLNANVVIIAMPAKDKAKMIDLFKQLSFSSLQSDVAVDWPSEIPADARINATILKIEKQNPSTDGFDYEYHVKAVMNDKLISELERIKAKYGDDLYGIKIGDEFVFICSNSEAIEYLKEDFRENDHVSFIYYKNSK